MGAFIGLLAGELVDFVGRRAAARRSCSRPARTVPRRRRFALYTVFLAVTAGAYAATAVGAARAEETATRGAIVLAGPVSRCALARARRWASRRSPRP